MIKKFNEYNSGGTEETGDGKPYLSEDDLALCLCDLFDEGFILDNYQQYDIGEDIFGDIDLYKRVWTSQSKLAFVDTANQIVWKDGYTGHEYEDLPYDQRRLCDMVADCAHRLTELIGHKEMYMGDVDFTDNVIIIIFKIKEKLS